MNSVLPWLHLLFDHGVFKRFSAKISLISGRFHLILLEISGIGFEAEYLKIFSRLVNLDQ